MSKAPILVIDDDADDLELIEATIAALGIERPIHFFRTGQELKQFLTATSASPFLILCDINLPGHDGFSIRKDTAEDNGTRYKSVPFIFWSTAASEKQIQQAYDLAVQGFFFKPSNFTELCDTFKSIVEYWSRSKHPKSVS